MHLQWESLGIIPKRLERISSSDLDAEPEQIKLGKQSGRECSVGGRARVGLFVGSGWEDDEGGILGAPPFEVSAALGGDAESWRDEKASLPVLEGLLECSP